MVSKKTIKGLDFETIEEYFQYIVDSKSNGNHTQVKDLFDDLSKSQKLDFYNWFIPIYEQKDFVELLNYLN